VSEPDPMHIEDYYNGDDPRCPFMTADGNRCILHIGPDHVPDAIFHQFQFDEDVS
jgi:hypothetical protein